MTRKFLELVGALTLLAILGAGAVSRFLVKQRFSGIAFQALSGTFTFDGSTLRLGDDGAPTRALAAPDRLRLESDAGSAAFHRGKVS